MQVQAVLFTLRIWSIEGKPKQWRARLQNVQSGEVTFAKDWEALIAQIEENLKELDTSQSIEQPEIIPNTKNKETHHENQN